MIAAFLVLMLVLPTAAHAQVSVILSGSRPVLRARVGGIVIDAPIRIPRTTRTSTSTKSPSRTTSSSRTTRASATASSILNTAEDYLGTPYVWGGESPRGFDCSGFVQYVFREHGIELPRNSRQQAQVGRTVPATRYDLVPGDLMFFASDGARIDHVAIYAGNDRIIQASGSAGAVVYDDLGSKRGRWFATHHIATRRVIADGRSLVGPLPANLLKFLQFDPPDHAPRR